MNFTAIPSRDTPTQILRLSRAKFSGFAIGSRRRRLAIPRLPDCFHGGICGHQLHSETRGISRLRRGCSRHGIDAQPGRGRCSHNVLAGKHRSVLAEPRRQRGESNRWSLRCSTICNCVRRRARYTTPVTRPKTGRRSGSKKLNDTRRCTIAKRLAPPSRRGASLVNRQTSQRCCS